MTGAILVVSTELLRHIEGVVVLDLVRIYNVDNWNGCSKLAGSGQGNGGQMWTG